jgi:ubiquinone/menaquinone biosynthesis C-methylase UbiE
MFDRIAGGYDRMNKLMTFGLDDWWRRITVRALAPAADAQMLDIGSGTGPFIPLLLASAPQGYVVGTDFTMAMMQAGQARLTEQSAFVCGDAMQLPFADATFDIITAGFVIRNVVDIDTTFRELHRITKTGGKLAILEVARPRLALVRWGRWGPTRSPIAICPSRRGYSPIHRCWPTCCVLQAGRTSPIGCCHPMRWRCMWRRSDREYDHAEARR